MATWVDKQKPGRRTVLGTYFDPNNDSTARKFISVGAVSNNDAGTSTSNTEHIIRLGSGLRSLALAASSIVEQARLRQDAAASVLGDRTGNVDPDPSPLFGFSEEDVSTEQSDLSRRAAAVFDTVQDANSRDSLSRRVGLFVENSRYGFAPIRSERARAATFNPIVPEIEEVSVDIDKGKGAVDNFHTTLLLNLHKDALNDVTAIRIFRATENNPVFTRPLATLSPSGIERLSAARGRKNEDPSQNQMRMEINGVPNSVSNLNYFDPYTGNRVSADSRAPLLIPPSISSQGNAAQANNNVPPALSHIDSSVLENINVLSNIQKSPIYGFVPASPDESISVGSNVNTGLKLGDKQQRESQSNISNNSFIIDESNKLNFQQLALLTIEKLKYRRIGDLIEIQFDDDSVSYGKGYKYFAVTVNKDMQQSARSQIVSAVIEGLRIPERPSSTAVSVEQTQIALSITVSDQLVEKFEIHRREYTSDRMRTSFASTVADKLGFTSSIYSRSISQNNFMLIGECMNGMKTGGQFTDKRVIPGRSYMYRIYSVDIFGNKSESPYEVKAFIPDREQQFVDIKAPSIISEVDGKTMKMKVSFQCDDKNVVRIRLDRRDLTLGQDDFSTPSAPPRTVIGMGQLTHRRMMEGERLYDETESSGWTGHFIPTHGQRQIFVDTTVASDHVYQYRIWGEDFYGNRSSYSLSAPTMVVRRAFINEPVNVLVNVTSSGDVTGVSMSWVEGNVDKPAEDLLGNQTTLADSSVRTLYQVQRLKLGDSAWANFPLMSGTSLFDPMVGEATTVAPNYRPSYPEFNQTYLYRVQAVQTGAFISNFSAPISVFTGKSMLQPINFKISTPNVQKRPFFVMLNWDTHPESGVVDYWEIERAAVNNFAAARLNVNNPAEFNNVEYKPFRKVYRESSRFVSKVMDDAASTNSAVISGEHHFLDTAVDFGNTYFYRIRAVSVEGTNSRWSYKGVKLTSAAFEKKWVPVLTDVEKRELSRGFKKMTLIAGTRVRPKNSFSMLPTYASPDSSRNSPPDVGIWGLWENK